MQLIARKEERDQQKQLNILLIKQLPILLCFVSCCIGLSRAEFVNKTVSFDDHIKTEHNLWHYLYFIVLLKLKKRTDFTGPQSYVSELIKVTIYYQS